MLSLLCSCWLLHKSRTLAKLRIYFCRSSILQAVKKVKELAVSIEGKSPEEKKSLLERCAATTLSSKLVGGEKEFFAKMVVDAVSMLGEDSRLNMLGMKKVSMISIKILIFR
jgi:chaperonin GroEL (HSP60 family)